MDATPISCPANIGKTKSEDLAIELSIVLTTPHVFALFFLHNSKILMKHKSKVYPKMEIIEEDTIYI